MLEAPVFLKALLKIIRELQERGRISPDTSPLPPEQLAGFREELEAELRRLERSMLVSDEGLKPVEVDPGTTGRLSRMDELQSQAMIDRLEVFPEVATCIACTALRSRHRGPRCRPDHGRWKPDDVAAVNAWPAPCSTV